MPVRPCPNCMMGVVVNKGDGDYVHECNSGRASVDQEDIPRMFGTSITSQSDSLPNAELQGSHFPDNLLSPQKESLTIRGNRTLTHFTRQHFEYIPSPE